MCRHEAMVNVAFAGTATTFLCPYDSVRLPAWVVANALATHPVVFALGVRQLNDTYLGPVIPPVCETPLPAPPAAEALTYVDDLRPVRAPRNAYSGSLTHCQPVDSAYTGRTR